MYTGLMRKGFPFSVKCRYYTAKEGVYEYATGHRSFFVFEIFDRSLLGILITETPCIIYVIDGKTALFLASNL